MQPNVNVIDDNSCRTVKLGTTLTGAVRRVIVHDQNADLRGCLADTAGDQRKVLNLVVGRDDNQGGSVAASEAPV